MDLSFYSLVLLSSLLVLFTIFIIWKKFHTPTKTNYNAIPGPPKLPLIGNLHQLVGGPHCRIADFSKTYGPIMHIQLGQLKTVVVTAPQLAKEILKDNDINFSQRSHMSVADIVFYNEKSLSFSPYGDYWRQMRKVAMTELLSIKRVQSFKFIREEEVSNVIRFINSKIRSPVNISDSAYSLINSIIARLLLGWKVENQQELIHLIHRVMTSLDGSTIVDLFPSLGFLHVISGQKSKLMKLHKKVDRMLEDIIENHKANRKGDDESEPNSLLDVLLKLQGSPDYNVTNISIKATILETFSGGVDSTARTIEWAMSELMRNPRVMKKVQEEVRKVYAEHGKFDETVHELKFLKAVIKETFRLHPPGTLMPRESKEECTISGYILKPKTPILINTWAMGRDPNHWTEPESFYPERFLDTTVDFKGSNFEFLPFGSGRRMCPGYNLGVAHVELTLAQLLNNFDWELPGKVRPEDLDMTEAFGVATRRKNDLYLIPTLPHSHG